MRKKNVVAIDGPAGAGKSTVAQKVAKSLGYQYIDTGAMYRALAYKIQQQECAMSPAALKRFLKGTTIHFKNARTRQHIFLDGQDVTKIIRTPQVTQAASVYATQLPVRQLLQDLQRQMGRQGQVVMEGRDIGTAVFPDAAHKFFLDASPEVRAKRRFDEWRAKDPKVTLTSIARAIVARDKKDRTRQESPLRVALDAFVIDSSGLSIRRVCELITARVISTTQAKSKAR